MSLSKHFHRVLSVSLCTLLLSMTSCQEKGNKDQCSLIPQPNELKTNAGHFAFNQSTIFYVSPELDKNSLSTIDSFAQNLNAISGFQTVSQPFTKGFTKIQSHSCRCLSLSSVLSGKRFFKHLGQILPWDSQPVIPDMQLYPMFSLFAPKLYAGLFLLFVFHRIT